MKIKKSFFSIVISALFFGVLSGCCRIPEKLELRAPSVLPHTIRSMKTAGFWINKAADPDRIIMTSQEIEALNARTQDQDNLINDMTRLQDRVKGKDVAFDLMQSLGCLRKRSLYLDSGDKAADGFFDPIITQMNLASLPDEIVLRYGLVVHYADQRVLPTASGLYQEKGDVDFDELQHSSLDVGTPIVILHQTRDGQWVYAKTQASAGWVQARHVAMAQLADIKHYAGRTRFVVVTAPKADIFLNRRLTGYYDYARMGTVLPLIRDEGALVKVRIPARGAQGRLLEVAGYLKKEQVNVGFLPYTRRNMIDQAFKMLNSPYGWGGMYGEQDCSAFLQEVFLTAGIIMPRNSEQQARVGILKAVFSATQDPQEKLAALTRHGVGGITTLYMKGHIMLYLGSVRGRPYAIHASWGYREKFPGVRVMNRVVVSDLSLGEGSKKKSLLERLLIIRQVSGPAVQ